MPKAIAPVIRVARYTFADEIRQRSVAILFVVFAAFIFLVRGCYHGHYVVNGQELDPETVIRLGAKATFHVIAVGVMLLTALLSMRAFRRDREDGMQTCILSRPVTRRQYVTGKILGLWSLTSLFMLVLHAIMFVVTSIGLKVVLPGYLPASLLCTANLFFIVTTVLLLSLWMPDIVAFFCMLGIGLTGLVADVIFALRHSDIAQAMMQQDGLPAAPAGWDAFFYAWPKLAAAQQAASSMIVWEGAFRLGIVFPFFNVLVYGLIFAALAVWCFRRQEII